MSSMEQAFAPAEAAARAAIELETWGHLYPKHRAKYQGELVFCVSDHENSAYLLRSEFVGLGSSPMLFDHVQSFVFQMTFPECDQREPLAMYGTRKEIWPGVYSWHDGDEKLAPGVYRWRGWYLPYNNGRCRFEATAPELIWSAAEDLAAP